MRWRSNPSSQKPEAAKMFHPSEMISPGGNDDDIQLPNLNASKSNLHHKSPYTKQAKNRRNLSIKQSWDKPNFHPKRIHNEKISKTSKNSRMPGQFHQRVLAHHNIDTTIKFKPAEEVNSPKNQEREELL